jgi:type VI secretion system secreted protein VgrG
MITSTRAVYTQEERRIGVATVLGEDALLLQSFEGTEQMSGLFSYTLDLLSENDRIDAKELIGKPVSFWILHPDDGQRYFHGYINRFEYIGHGDRLSIYRAHVVPWLWFESQRFDCRIFQHKTVPEIIRAVFESQGFVDFDDSYVRGDYQTLEYCVQYNESDFAFVSRLMEEVGIFYFFRHEENRHVMMMADSTVAFQVCRDSDVVFDDNLSQRSTEDGIWQWQHQYEFRPGRWAHQDFNFKSPQTDLTVSVNSLVELPRNSDIEVYEYPGGYEARDDGDGFARVRMEAEESQFDIVSGRGSCRSFSPGARFRINSDREEGADYFVTGIAHHMDASGQFTSGSAATEGYENAFTCVPGNTSWRTERQTPRPSINGSQTAIVVGPAGEEIYTDEFGRIKVQFHWDRKGQNDENSSCWMRVSQGHAGQGWGMMDLPRIGEEVIVSFLEGNPDRPIIVGRVYNAVNMPPFSLPAQKTRRGNTTKTYKGDGHNELSMDDTPDQQQLRMNAQRDMDSNVNNNQTLNVGVDRTAKVGNNEKSEVGVNQDLKIGADQVVSVGANQSVSVGASQMIDVGSDVVIKAGSSITLKCGASTLHMDKGGFIQLTGTVLTLAGAANASLSAPITNVTGAVLLTNAGGVVQVAGGLTQVRGAKVDVLGGQTVIKGGPITLN